MPTGADIINAVVDRVDFRNAKLSNVKLAIDPAALILTLADVGHAQALT